MAKLNDGMKAMEKIIDKLYKHQEACELALRL
jgi:hypothetical protein